MKHSFYIFALLMIGFLMHPTGSYACSKKKVDTEKTCCSSKKQSKFYKNSCSDLEQQEKKSCDGSCNSSDCHFAPFFSSTIAEFLYTIPKKVDVIYSKQSNFFYLEKNTSLNYFAIWSPPKIG